METETKTFLMERRQVQKKSLAQTLEITSRDHNHSITTRDPGLKAEILTGFYMMANLAPNELIETSPSLSVPPRKGTSEPFSWFEVFLLHSGTLNPSNDLRVHLLIFCKFHPLNVLGEIELFCSNSLNVRSKI